MLSADDDDEDEEPTKDVIDNIFKMKRVTTTTANLHPIAALLALLLTVQTPAIAAPWLLVKPVASDAKLLHSLQSPVGPMWLL